MALLCVDRVNSTMKIRRKDGLDKQGMPFITKSVYSDLVLL